MGFFKRLLTGCLRHSDTHERDAQGRYELVCETCGDRRIVLPGQDYPVRAIKALKAKKVKKPKAKKASKDVWKPVERKEVTG